KIARKAEALAPNCPLVLWDLAGALDANGNPLAAAEILHRLIDRGEWAIARDKCGEGKAWARSLVTDCWYRIGVCFEHAELWSQADHAFKEYLRRRPKTSGSIYDSADASRHLSRVQAHLSQTVK